MSDRPRKPSRSDLRPVPEGVERARELRRTMSMPERVLWNQLKLLRDRGLKFRRQHPIGPWVADFYCHAAAMVFEVDGHWTHGNDGFVRERQRNAWMRSRGLHVVRYAAAMVNENVHGVVRSIEREARARIAHLQAPSPGSAGEVPSPRGGGGDAVTGGDELMDG